MQTHYRRKGGDRHARREKPLTAKGAK